MFSDVSTAAAVFLVNLDEIAECVYRIPCKKCDKVCIGETGRSFGVRMKEHQKSRHKKGVNIPEVRGNNHNQNRTNLQSQITSTKKIMSLTGTRPRSSFVSQTRLQGGFARQSRSNRRVKVS